MIFLIKEKTLGWFHPDYLLPAAPPPRTHLQLSRCVQEGRRVLEHWRTRRSVCAGRWVSRSTGSLWASRDSRQRRHCVSWELLGAADVLAGWAVLGRRDTDHIWMVCWKGEFVIKAVTGRAGRGIKSGALCTLHSTVGPFDFLLQLFRRTLLKGKVLRGKEEMFYLQCLSFLTLLCWNI